ncbi:MAG TPA: glutamate--tRNA ligase [Saprospiraceae bacterium]|nr:glutamate--tRNA ligase [Saprospiraceae bacterium]
MRVRFAPSPTGILHIGGIRTALYNYLLAKKHKGTFILRIEDTDQNRYVPGAEEYIIDALKWCGIEPDEGSGYGGNFGPYRQSERKSMYMQYAQHLLENGNAYYAFDTSEELEAARKADPNFIYNQITRMQMKNSLTMSDQDVNLRLAIDKNYVIRLKVPDKGEIIINDLVRGKVVFDATQIDDKVMLKADGMPTYHLANVVDDHLMEISDVIRGEEWLSSTPHHVLLYQFLGWESTMPSFSHLPLILKPNGNGKLSKRDGPKFNIPIFPLAWKGSTIEENVTGFKETGFLPAATINFLALLGWNPGNDKEIYNLEELVEEFSLEKIHQSGARFDYEKALWFNHQYIQTTWDEELAQMLIPLCEQKAYTTDINYLKSFCRLMKNRIQLLPEFLTIGYYFFTDDLVYDHDMIHKKWNSALSNSWSSLIDLLKSSSTVLSVELEPLVKSWMQEQEIKPGEILPLMRLALAGTMQGPGVFEMIELLGIDRTILRMELSLTVFNAI